MCCIQIVDNTGKVKGWLDGSHHGNWLRHVRSTDAVSYNLLAIQVQDGVSNVSRLPEHCQHAVIDEFPCMVAGCAKWEQMYVTGCLKESQNCFRAWFQYGHLAS